MLSKLLASAAIAAALSSAAFADDGVFDLVSPFEIKGAEPGMSGYIFLQMEIAETLVNAAPDGTLTPGLATEWHVSDDGLAWHFHLREGVRFHDGSALSAEGVAVALNAARGKPGLLSSAPITEIVADGGEVVIRLSEPFAPIPAFLTEYRNMILAPTAYAADGSVTEVIGSGAYRITAMAPPLRLDAERFDGYWGPAPAIDRAAYHSVGRAETRALMAESGDGDYVVNLDAATLARLATDPDLTVQSVSIPRAMLVKLNSAHPFLADVRVRQALSLAIDREGLASAVLRYPAAADQILPPLLAEWHSDSVEPLRYDPEAARALLAEAGWQPGADGVLTRDGERFSMVLTSYPDRPEMPLSAAVLQQLFADVGVELVLDLTNSSEIPLRHGQGTLEMALFARNFALTPSPVGTFLTDYAPNGDWGAMGWANTEFPALIHQIARGEGGQEARNRAIEILQTDLPVLPVAWYQQNVAISRAVTGAVVDPFERSVGLRDARWAE